MPGRPQNRRLVPAEHPGVGQPVQDTIPASADVTAETTDDLLGLPALEMLPHGVVDAGQEFVAGSGRSGPDRPVRRDRQLPAHGQLGHQRAGQANVDEGVAPTGTCPLSFTATSSSISAISTALALR
jgi:hypothetical protein